MALRIGDLARRAGLATSALRFYEDEGLLAPSGRTEAGYRVYDAAALGRLAFIRRARALGLTLQEIRELVSGASSGVQHDRDRVRHVVAHKLAETERRTAELTALKSELESLYVRLLRAPGPECGHVGDCGCWLPNEEEVMAMTEDLRSVQACGCCDCPQPGCDCDCDCCGA